MVTYLFYQHINFINVLRSIHDNRCYGFKCITIRGSVQPSVRPSVEEKLSKFVENEDRNAVSCFVHTDPLRDTLCYPSELVRILNYIPVRINCFRRVLNQYLSRFSLQGRKDGRINGLKDNPHHFTSGCRTSFQLLYKDFAVTE